MAAQNGKTGVPTGSLSDNHIFLVRSQTNLYIIEGNYILFYTTK